MKTSVLRKIVEENGYDFEKTKDFIYISYIGLKTMTLDFQDQSISLDIFVKLGSPRIKRIMVALIEYSLTPLNEREDEKKYRIMIDNNFFTGIEFLTLRLNNNTYYFSAFDNNGEKYQKIFTQSEIDNFPAEIKGAIECGFLRKVEVE